MTGLNEADCMQHIQQRWRQSSLLVCLSARSAFDLLLQQLALPLGSEVLVSALTIPDMVRIIEHHGLVAVPVAIDPDTLAVRMPALEAASSNRSRVLVVAHLWGTRLDLSALIDWAQTRKILLVEDCAQAYEGCHWSGDPRSDVRLFSFGNIKTATALGGGVMLLKDQWLCRALQQRQQTYASSSNHRFALKTIKYMGLKCLSMRLSYGLLVRLAQVLGADYNVWITQWVKGFPAAELMPRLRQRPSLALLRLLTRRFAQNIASEVEKRQAVAHQFMALCPERPFPGHKAEHHSFWVFPVAVKRPQRLVDCLQQQGIDATRQATLEPVAGQFFPAAGAMQRWHQEFVYLPVYSGVSVAELQKMADCWQQAG